MYPFRKFVFLPELESLNQTMNEMMDPFRLSSENLIPIEIIEGKGHYRIRAIVAGANSETLDIHANGKNLIISGEIKDSKPLEDDEILIHNEIKQGKFSRQITLKYSVDNENISAELVNGILEIFLPKAEPSLGKSVKILMKDREMKKREEDNSKE